MSMINDALRSASHASKSGSGALSPAASPFSAASPYPPPPPAAPLEGDLPPAPAFGGEPPCKSNKLQLILVLLLLLSGGVAVGGIIWEKKNRSARVAPASATGQKPILPNAAEARSQSNALAAAAAKVPTNPAPQTVVAIAAPVAAPTPPVKFPPLRLQSIFYRPANPSVIINGKTLFVTDEINGVKVSDIQPANVTLVLSNQTNILTLR